MKHVYSDYIKLLRNTMIKPLAKAAVKEMHGSKEEERHIAKKLMVSLENGLEEYLSFLNEATKLLRLEGKLPAIFLSGEAPKILKEQKWIEEGKILQEALGITDHEFITMYDVAKDYFDRTAYREATAIFTLMVEINPVLPIGWIGLGLCYDRTEHYKEAATLYLMAAELENIKLSSYFWAAECLAKMGMEAERQKILQHVIERCEKDPNLKLYKDEAKKLLNFSTIR